MTTFAVNHGPTSLCTWELGTGHPTFHQRAPQRGGVLIVKENDRLGFILNPADATTEHRVFIGDVPVSDLVSGLDVAAGVVLAGQRFWSEHPYFESARGQSEIAVEARSDSPNTKEWRRIFTVQIYVVPSKIGENHYQGMTYDLQLLNRSLLADLYGKSTQTQDLRFAHEGLVHQSREHELASIRMILGKLSTLLHEIAKRPVSRVRSVRSRQIYWGDRPLTPMAIAGLSRRGVHPARSQRPLAVTQTQRVESFDVPEHRLVRAFLDLLIRRANSCARAAAAHIDVIVDEKEFRNANVGAGPSIYETIDIPRIRRLTRALQDAREAGALATAMTELPYLRDVPPQFATVRGGAFQRSPEYRCVLGIVRGFLLANAVWYDGDKLATVTKLTSRLFEQWCYLRIVDAFRECGIDLEEWDDALRQNLSSRFILDFDRGLRFEGSLGSALRLRFRYEPWILGRSSALEAGETLCRGRRGEAAWCPDIVIECLQRDAGDWQAVYGIVLDCKYSTAIREHHWTDTAKYLEIRSTHSQRQVVKQLWLVAPCLGGAISSEDPAVAFDEAGPTCNIDEAVRFRLHAVPPDGQPEAGGSREPRDSNPFMQFAHGTVSFLRRAFGARLDS